MGKLFLLPVDVCKDGWETERGESESRSENEGENWNRPSECERGCGYMSVRERDL